MPDKPRPTAVRRLLRWSWIVGMAVLVGYLVNVVAAMLLEDSLIYFPSVYPSGNWDTGGLAVEDAWFQSGDGTRLHGWYFPNERAQAAVLFCHGNGGNLTHRTEAIRTLRRRGNVSVLIFDYRGYGRSEGKPNEAGVLADARAARDWLADREKIPPSEVVMMGESLGGAVAVDLAARDGARALILESTFDSLPNVASFHYPWLPVRLAMRTRFDSAAKIADYHGPLLMAHGDIDTIVPIRYARRLFEAANEPKQFMLVSDHDHNEPMPPNFYDAIRELLEKNPVSKSPPNGGESAGQ